jgi:phosphate transport system substrate-binding protein
MDVLGVFAMVDNPVQQRGLSLPEVDAIFSTTRLLGRPQRIKTWGDLGLEGEYADAPIRVHGRNSATGTYGWFKKVALGKGDFGPWVREGRVILSKDFDIGYTGIGYASARMRPVPLAAETGGKPVDATPENVLAGTYPLGRFLYLTFNVPPGKSLSGIEAEFLRFVYSREGQDFVVKDGFHPVPTLFAREDAARAGITLFPEKAVSNPYGTLEVGDKVFIDKERISK